MGSYISEHFYFLFFIIHPHGQLNFIYLFYLSKNNTELNELFSEPFVTILILS